MSTTRRAAAEGEVDEAPPTPTVAAGPRLLTRAAILAAPDTTYEDMEIPEWGGVIRVRSLTGTERDAYDSESYLASQQKGGTALDQFRVRRVAKCIVDENGLRVFSDADVAVLGEKNGSVIDRIDDVIVRLSGIGQDAVDKAKADLKADPSAGSGSA